MCIRDSYYPSGKVAIRDGAMMASSDRFHITIHGKSSHGSAPESGIDAITAAAQVISALQTIVSRRVSPCLLYTSQYYSKSNNTIPVHIRHLREKLNDSTEHPKYIKTIWGVGYKIEK